MVPARNPLVDRGHDAEVLKMTVIGTDDLSVDSLGGPHRAIVRAGFLKCRDSFLILEVGEKKPFTGFTQNGPLDLVYREGPLEAPFF